MKFIVLNIIYVDTIIIKEALGMYLCHTIPVFVHQLLDVYLV